jgi:hypothetical protein
MGVPDALDGPKGEELVDVSIGLNLLFPDLDAVSQEFNLGRRAAVHKVSSLNIRMQFVLGE